MKKLIYLMLGLSAPVLASAQLQNLDFEQWNPGLMNKPAGWENVISGWRTNSPIGLSSYQATANTAAQSNSYALTMSVWYNYTKDAAAQKASINYRPQSLKGFYTYTENIIEDGLERITDTAQVTVILTKWNSAAAKSDTVGIGVLDIFQAQTSYKSFQVDINYLSSAIPDTIDVYLDPSLIKRASASRVYQHAGGGSSYCSYFTVDNLSLISGSNPTGINHIHKQKQIALFPNPATNTLHFNPVTGVYRILDINGRQVSTASLNKAAQLDISQLNPGTYMIQITSATETRYGQFIKL